MAVNFGLLQPAQPVSAFFQGQQDIRAEQDRNMLRQQQAQQLALQQENALALREQRMASAAEAKAKTERAAQRQTFLTNLGAKMAEGGYKLDRPTLGQVLQYGMQSGEDSLIKLATEGMKALDEEDLYQREASRFGLPGGAAPAPAAPVNALAAPPAAAGVTRAQVQQMLTSPSARIREQGKALAQTLPKEAKPTPAETEELVMRLQDPTLTPAARKRLEARLDILTKREPKEPREPAIRTAKVDLADGSIGVMNLDTGVVTPATVGGQPAKGKPSAFAEKTAAQRKQLSFDIDRAITELKDVSTEDGLIDQSTGSGFGRLRDVTAGFVGKATSGAIAIGKLAPIADMVLKMVPRFEGPQSDKDTKSYKEAAGQLADATLPTDIRKAAAKQIVRIMEARKGQFVTQEMAAEGAAPATAAPAGFPAPPQGAIDALKRGQGTDAQFDAIFGPGAAARARRQ